MNSEHGLPPPRSAGQEHHIRAPERALARNGRAAGYPATGEQSRADDLSRLTPRLKLVTATWRDDNRAHLTRMITQIESVSSSEWEWQRLRRQLETADPDYGRRLDEISSEMTRLERKVSLLMGLGLPIEQIARTLRQPAGDIEQICAAVSVRLAEQLSGAEHATP